MSAIKKAIRKLDEAAEKLCVVQNRKGEFMVLNEFLGNTGIINAYKLIKEVQGYLEVLDDLLHPTGHMIHLIRTGEYDISRVKEFLD